MQEIVNKQRTYYFSGATRPYAFRVEQLKKLQNMLKTYEKDIYRALKADLNKSKHEAITTELGVLHTEIDFALKHLKDWMEDEEVPAPLTHKGSNSYITYEPYGVTLVIAPWNYPLQLALAPVIGALAAGNTVVLKPSEISVHTSNLLNKMISATFEPEICTVVEGAVEETNALLEQRFDYIFFTGSTHIGKIIMEKASKHLTPVTLELGGKSPTIVDEDCNISLSAKRIVWGKYTNAGQTCVAPDYVYVHEKIYMKFLRALKRQIHRLYGKRPLNNKDYGRIINKKHFDRLTKLLEDAKIYHGGEVSKENLTIEPTIVTDITWNDPVMQEEIFGPILPVLSYSNIDEVILKVQENDKPLALYYFGNNKENEEKVLTSIPFGGGCVNDTLYHLATPYLPFGGVGPSGIGAYHGKYSFETFSHRKSILKQTTLFDNPVRYPGGRIKQSLAKSFLM
ncbi:MAG TPA: aldehyde dehydrogenase [Pseudogracilibacillus sp.]|nr:aldehyde dehydrogenase [Pseudogracilibacillus sp.]